MAIDGHCGLIVTGACAVVKYYIRFAGDSKIYSALYEVPPA
jgi:hypothetical protein